MGDIIPYSDTERKVTTIDFFAAHPVFSLDEVVRVLAPDSARSTLVERLKHHLEMGRLKLVTREVYAVVPAGSKAAQFRPDPFLVAAVIRPDAVFSHHSALELLGTAHSVWNRCTLYTRHRRRRLNLEGGDVLFMEHPTAMVTGSDVEMGTRQAERQRRLLRTTGPERTLVEGFRRPSLVGGLEELVASAGGFASLDLAQLETILQRYRSAHLWAAVGWFLERYQATFQVPAEVLGRMEDHRPCSPRYLERGRRGGVLVKRWNLIVPETVLNLEEPNES
jgi:predicted transcriptional regulator of viral defense system